MKDRGAEQRPSRSEIILKAIARGEQPVTPEPRAVQLARDTLRPGGGWKDFASRMEMATYLDDDVPSIGGSAIYNPQSRPPTAKRFGSDS